MELLHEPGDIIADRYQIIEALGQGGIGITYAAIDRQSDRQVAIKELSLRRLNDWKVLELFEREAKILSQLNHPNIPRYLNYFQVDTSDNRHFYLVQELAEGRSLASLIESGWHASENEVRQIAEQILEILSYLQALKPPIVHRDLQPQNIIRREDGMIFLVDFGAVQNTYCHTLMQGSTVVGTYGYMAPEQFRGQAFPATDLFGLGATLLFLLTHQSPADLPQQRLKINFRSRVQISDNFADWLEILLEPVPEDRFSSAKEASAALRDDYLQYNYPLDKNYANVGAATISLVQKQRQPGGSGIVLKRTPQRLVVDVPAAGLRVDRLSWLGFALMWSGFLFFWTASALATSASLFFPLFSIPFWLAVLGIWGSTLFAIVGKTRLEIDRQTFRLQWQLFKLRYQIQGRTTEIDRVELSSAYQINGQPVITCTLVEGVRTHRFGARLSQLEQEWLIQEIAAFLGKPPSSQNPQSTSI